MPWTIDGGYVCTNRFNSPSSAALDRICQENGWTRDSAQWNALRRGADERCTARGGKVISPGDLSRAAAELED
jgi:hypothetical protein